MKTTVAELRSLAVRALGRMYRPDAGLFAFRLRRTANGDILEGVSRRYTAIVLIGLAGEAEETAAEILAGRSPRQACSRLVDDNNCPDDLGEVSLGLWAARVLEHERVGELLARLKAMEPATGAYPMVELSWCLTALTVPGSDATDTLLADAVAGRLLASFNTSSALFPHWPAGVFTSRLRAHVCCYADLVYPIQALSHYYLATGRVEALKTAKRCAQRMCKLQGPQGQWWWHYDVRSAQVVERFPVYAVHQDAMGPMALFALQKAGGGEHNDAIAQGLRWLANSPELEGSLVDTERGVIWRKVGRREPGKLTRRLQAASSRVHPSLRAPGVNMLFPPRRVDFESRPYHMGWILHAWSGGQLWPQDPK